MESFPDRTIASASTSDHHPMPMQATVTGSNGISFLASADRRGCRLRHTLVELEAATAHADAADAFAVDDDRAATLHRGPALLTGREREPDGVRHVERLPLCAACRRGPLAGRRAGRLGRRGVHCMESPAVHALEQK